LCEENKTGTGIQIYSRLKTCGWITGSDLSTSIWNRFIS